MKVQWLAKKNSPFGLPLATRQECESFSNETAFGESIFSPSHSSRPRSHNFLRDRPSAYYYYYWLEMKNKASVKARFPFHFVRPIRGYEARPKVRISYCVNVINKGHSASKVTRRLSRVRRTRLGRPLAGLATSQGTSRHRMALYF